LSYFSKPFVVPEYFAWFDPVIYICGMFIKTIVKTDKKTGKRYNYYRLCESYRIGNKTRHRSIVSMGRLDGIESREDKKLLADTIEALIHGETRLSFFDAGPEITRYAKEFAKRITDEKLLDIQPKTTQPEYSDIEPDHQEVDLNSMRHDEVREIGAEWLCKQALEQLDLQELLTGTCGFSDTSTSTALMHITSRAVYPASEHKTAQWIYDENVESHLFLVLLAYQVVATIRCQLKAKNIHHDWRNIVRIMNTQKEVVTTIKNKKGKTIRIKKCSVPSVGAKQIYEALVYKTVPYYMKNSVLPEL